MFSCCILSKSGRAIFLGILYLCFLFGNYSLLISTQVDSELSQDQSQIYFQSLLDDLVRSCARTLYVKENVSEQEAIQLIGDTILSKSKETIRPDVKILLQQLNVLLGHVKHPECSLLNKLAAFNTSVFERVELANVLTKPLTDIAQLQKRQAGIKTLSENTSLLNTVNECAALIEQSQENMLDSFRGEKSKVFSTGFPLNNVYFRQWPLINKLNDYAGMLCVKSFLTSTTSSRIYMEGAYLLCLCGSVVLDLYKVGSITNNNNNMVNLLKTAINGFLPYVGGKSLDQNKNNLIQHIVAFIQARIISNMAMQSFCNRKTLFSPITGSFLYNIISDSFNIYTLYSCYKELKDVAKTVKLTHSFLCDIEQIARAYDQLYLLVMQNSKLQEALQTLGVTVEAMPAQTPQFKELLTLLRTQFLKKDISSMGALFQSGQVLKARALLQKCKHEFAPMIDFIAKVGVLRIAANLQIAHQAGHTKICFPEYVEQEQALIDAQNMWNLELDKEKAVCNSVKLGDSNPNGLLITGSNTAGKSTFQKALLQIPYLAQTLCIAPAERATITPFDRFGVSLHITDDIVSGDSLYMAEIRSLKNLSALSKLAKNSNKKVFLLADEPFKGTGADKGAELLMMYIKNLLRLNDQKSLTSVITCFATHYHEATKLEAQYPRSIANGRVDAQRKADGTYIRPFKFEYGKKSECNIAEEIAKEILDTVEDI